MKEIRLACGRIALVDDSDYEWLSMWKWRYHRYGAGYAKAWINGKTVFMHRLITAAPRSKQVDHRNLNGLDNQRANLRIAVRGQNNANRLRQPNNQSGFKGVDLVKKSGKWRSTIQKDGKARLLGLFDNPIDAAKAYDAAARELFGEFSRLNFECVEY